MEISQETIVNILQIGGQYLIPSAALLRALYSGLRGRMPEGFAQIAVASLFAGLTAAADGQNVDIRGIALEILGNTAFMAGLLSFIMIYLIRQPNRGHVVDGGIGAIIGLISWLIWVQALGNDWPVWTAPLIIIGGGALFIALREALRQIIRLVKIATYLIIAGGFFVAIAALLYVGSLFLG